MLVGLCFVNLVTLTLINGEFSQNGESIHFRCPGPTIDLGEQKYEQYL